MDLVLWRHADAEYGPPDLQRQLTPLGRQQAHDMADWLRPRLPKHARVLVSPAQRAQQTAAALGRPFDTIAALAPGAALSDVLAASDWAPSDEGCVVVVGHNPTLGEVAARLLGANGAVAVRKGAVWWFVGRERGERPVVLHACISPNLLAAGETGHRH
ncbi:MAG: histidine phosphatase family protein [Betaproteobacteria bacterium]|jgi:phosphohistidine phosphatase|nr:histidine phosphatase family protein [Betaproteobacteria bacterium]